MIMEQKKKLYLSDNKMIAGVIAGLAEYFNHGVFVLSFPFENCNLTLNADSAIISTMCKDYSSRLEEWIEYNFQYHHALYHYNDQILGAQSCNQFV